MKKIIVSALTCALIIACSLSIHADCTLHGARYLSKTCSGYPNSCEVRDCFVGSHPKECQTQRFSNYYHEACSGTISENGIAKPCSYSSHINVLHLCYVIHPAVSGSDYRTNYCPY